MWNRAETIRRAEDQGRVLRAAALLSGARLPDSGGGDAGDLAWSQLESADRRAAETLGWGYDRTHTHTHTQRERERERERERDDMHFPIPSHFLKLS